MEIALPTGANAEPNTCGSCKFFKRTGDDYASIYRSEGWCRIKLPAWVAVVPIKTDDEGNGTDTWGSDHVNDTDRCDLWKTSGNVYIVSRRVG